MVAIAFFHCIFSEHFRSGTSPGAFWFVVPLFFFLLFYSTASLPALLLGSSRIARISAIQYFWRTLFTSAQIQLHSKVSRYCVQSPELRLLARKVSQLAAAAIRVGSHSLTTIQQVLQVLGMFLEGFTARRFDPLYGKHFSFGKMLLVRVLFLMKRRRSRSFRSASSTACARKKGRKRGGKKT